METTATDMWRFGLLAHEILTGQTQPFGSRDSQTEEALEQFRVPDFPHVPSLRPRLRELLLRCFLKDRAQRPSARQFLKFSEPTPAAQATV